MAIKQAMALNPNAAARLARVKSFVFTAFPPDQKTSSSLIHGSAAAELHAVPFHRQPVRFLGNKTFNADQLSARVLATPSSFAKRYFKIFGTKRCYPSDGLGPDVLRLKQFYENNGFYDTKVDTIVRPVSRSAVAVTFRIDEGQPLTLDTLEITGLDSVANRQAVTRDLALKQGGRFGRLQMYTDIDSIVARLRNSGYPSASVLREYTTHRAEHLAEVHLDVTPGPLAHFGTIAVSSLNVNGGPSDIDSSVVLGLLGFRQGDRYSDRALLDAQRNLYNLGAYRHVGVELDSASLGDSVANVRVDLREDFMRQFDLQEGWATLDCLRINAQYTNKNFLDQAKRIELTARMSKLGYAFPRNAPAIRNLCYRPYLDQDSTFSSKLNYYTGATFRQPTLFGTHWVPAYTAYTERHGEYRAYLRTTFIGADASATRNIGFGMPLAICAVPGTADGNGEGGYGTAGGGVAHFRITPQMPDDHDFIQASAHIQLLL